MDILEFLILLISGIAIGIMDFNILIYIFFMIYLFINIINYKKDKNIIHMIKITLYSVIIPNNYIIILVLVIQSIYLIIKRRQIKVTILNIVFIMYIFFNLIIHKLMLPNILFSLLYCSTIFLSYYVCKNMKEELQENLENIVNILKKIIIVELITIITYFVCHINEVRQSIDFDWVVGTFGKYQGNILLFFMLFSFLLLSFNYQKNKNKNDIIYILITIIISILTGSIALLILFIITYTLHSLFSKTSKRKISKVILIILAIIIFISVTPKWIKEYIKNLVDYDYMIEHITKINSYDTVFLKIPKNDKKFLFFGNGIGNYSSRSALTCTGEYIGFYSKVFNTSMSEYTEQYIYPNLVYVMENKLGSMDTAYSSIITIQGEYGLIGIIFLIIYFVKFYKNGNDISKTFILFFIFSCFIENYLEFAKATIVVFMLYFIVLNKKGESNEKR